MNSLPGFTQADIDAAVVAIWLAFIILALLFGWSLCVAAKKGDRHD